jgi:hypothetical protein
MVVLTVSRDGDKLVAFALKFLLRIVQLLAHDFLPTRQSPLYKTVKNNTNIYKSFEKNMSKLLNLRCTVRLVDSNNNNQCDIPVGLVLNAHVPSRAIVPFESRGLVPFRPQHVFVHSWSMHS